MPFSINPSQAPLLGAGLFILIVIGWLLFRREAAFPYKSAEALLTAGERAFSRVLYQAIGDEFRICHKVRLADVIVVRPGISAKHRRRCFGRIASKHLDFVLCDPETFQVRCVVELDDRSHRDASRQQRDSFVDQAITAAGLPILHMPAQRSYSVRKLRDQIYSILNTRGAVIAERH